MTIVKALYGHDSFETAYCVDNYPYGKLRTKMYFWLETRPKFGVRLVTRSLNPKNGQINKPHAGQYMPLAANLYIDQNGHCQYEGVGLGTDSEKVVEFVQNFPENPRNDLLKAYCLEQYKYYRIRVDAKRSFWTINGVEEQLSEPEYERYVTSKDKWWKAYLTVAGKPADTAEPELKKKA